jgi:hypothetical protein
MRRRFSGLRTVINRPPFSPRTFGRAAQCPPIQIARCLLRAQSFACPRLPGLAGYGQTYHANDQPTYLSFRSSLREPRFALEWNNRHCLAESRARFESRNWGQYT